MIGIALAYFLFPAFNSDTDPDAWLNVYWLLAGISLLSFDFYFSLGLKIKQKSRSGFSG
jgi:hypothetical protein